MVNSEGNQQEPYKLLIIFLYLTASAFSNWIVLSYIHDIVGRTPLPDIVFNLVEEKLWAVRLGDTMVVCCSLSIIALFVFHKQRFILIRRICFIIAVLYTFRSILMLATQLPSSYSNNELRCRKQLSFSERTFAVYVARTFEQAFHLGFQSTNGKMLCGDLLFSGHTLIMVIAMLSVDYYAPWFKYATSIFALVGICCMVISRTHYTCDVLVGYLCAVGVFSFYHAFCEVDTMNRQNSILQRFYVVQIVSWLERDIGDHLIDNKFEVPHFYHQISQLWSNPDKSRRRNEMVEQKWSKSNGSDTGASV